MRQLTWRTKCVIVGAISMCGYSAWADLVYQDSFTGSSGSFLDSNAPTQSNNSGGEIGTSTPLWMAGNKAPGGPGVLKANDFKADGSVNTNGSLKAASYAYLPFTPQVGTVYQYSATLNATQTGTPASRWIAMGFTQNYTNIRWVDSGTSSAAWQLHRAGGYNTTTFDSAFIGPDNGSVAGSSAATGGQDGGTAANIMNPIAQLALTPVDVVITLDTTAPNWVVTWQMRNHNNPTDPLTTVRGPLQYASVDGSINYMGFMALDQVTAQVSNFEVDRNAPTLPTWNVDSDGTWTNSSNWLNGVPNSGGVVANFGTAIMSTRTVTVDSPQTVGVLQFTSPTSYTIASSGGSAINFTSGSVRGGINVGAGAQEISAPLTQTGSIDIAVANGASLKLSTQSTLDVNSINTPGTAKLDITSNSMILPYTTSPLTSIKAQIISGYAGGSWTGAGINSSTAAADANHSTGIGYADNTVLADTTFAGQSVASKSVLLRYTYYGDTNLDGTVNALDFNALATNFGKAGPWTSGDFDYSGTVDSSDFALLAANYGKTLPSMASTPASALGQIVPEPSSFLLCGGIGVTLLRRRRQSHL